MKMSKGQFEFIAATIRKAATAVADKVDPIVKPCILETMAKTFADELAQTNPLFSRDKFVAAVIKG